MEQKPIIVDRVIVIVDGDLITLDVYEEILKEFSQDIYKAQNELELKDILYQLKKEGKQVDLAFIYDLTGKEACRLIKETSPGVKTFCLTNNNLHKLEDARKDGFDHLLLKANSLEGVVKAMLRSLLTFYN